MMEHNKGYSHHLYDDQDIELFIKDNYDDKINKAFKSLIIGAAKADLWRYLVLYKYGGIYLDLDSALHGSLDDLIDNNDELLISREGNEGLFVQWCLMCAPHHPIFKAIIEECVDNILEKKYHSVEFLTGPRTVSKVLQKALTDESINNLWGSSDRDLNKIFNSSHRNNRCRFYGTDYGNYATFKTPHSACLYERKEHWRTEEKTQGIYREQ